MRARNCFNTDGRLVWNRAHRKSFNRLLREFDLRGPGKVFMAEYAKYVAHKNEKLGSAGSLSDIRAKLKK